MSKNKLSALEALGVMNAMETGGSVTQKEIEALTASKHHSRGKLITDCILELARLTGNAEESKQITALKARITKLETKIKALKPA